MISMDALFGLPRKKSSGQSHREALHGNVFFKSQSSVDEHVANASQRKSSDKVTCFAGMMCSGDPKFCVYNVGVQ